MPVTCPTCGEDEELQAEQLEDGRRQITCASCGEVWMRGEPRVVYKSVHSAADVRAQFFGSSTTVSPETAERVEQMKARYLKDKPEIDPRTQDFRNRYKEAFSLEQLPNLTIEDIRYFGNSNLAGNPGNMSVFNVSLHEYGDEEATRRVREAIQYLLYGPEDTWLEDRLTNLILDSGGIGIRGFREALLTKVLCMAEPDRFLPITKYTGLTGKREIAKWIFDLDLPHPEATKWTIGRLIIWSNDVLVAALGDGFKNTEHMAGFLWSSTEGMRNTAGGASRSEGDANR